MNTLFAKKESCDILTRIDKKVSESGKKIYEKYAFGVKLCGNDNIEILTDLRSILTQKRNGSDCYSDISEETILSIINKYLY